MSKWQIMLDLGMIAAIAIIIFVAVRQGFIKSFFKSTKLLIVIIITAVLGSCFVGACENHIVSKVLEGRISSAVVRVAEEKGDSLDFEAIIDSVPNVAKNVIPIEKIKDYYNSLTGSNTEIAAKIGHKIEDVSIIILSKIMAYLGTFILIYIVISAGVMLLEKIGEFPILSELNRLFGCVWGVCYAYLFVSFAVCAVLLWQGSDFIEGTFITRYIYRLGLFTR